MAPRTGCGAVFIFLVSGIFAIVLFSCLVFAVSDWTELSFLASFGIVLLMTIVVAVFDKVFGVFGIWP